MSRPKGVPRSNISRIDNTVLDSEAFSVLSASAIRIYLGFLRRRRWDKARKRWTNLKDIRYTLDCMAYEGNVSPQAALDARQKLIDVGFIDLEVRVKGGVYGEDRKPNVYAISERYLKWRLDPKERALMKFKEHPKLAKKTAPRTAFKKAVVEFSQVKSA